MDEQHEHVAWIRGRIRWISSPLNTKLVVEVHDEEIRAVKADVLREAASEFRREAEAGRSPESNLLAATLLEQRAARIAAGEDDHSRVAPDEFDAESSSERDAPSTGADSA